MSPIIKNTVLGIMLIFAYPISTLADVNIIFNTPSYKHNSPNYYSNNYKYNKYKQNTYRNHHHRNKSFNKYDFAPYSYRSKQYDYTHGKQHYSYPRKILRHSFNRIYNYSPYAHNYNKYQHQKEKAYWQGYKDGYNQHRKSYRLGK